MHLVVFLAVFSSTLQCKIVKSLNVNLYLKSFKVYTLTHKPSYEIKLKDYYKICIVVFFYLQEHRFQTLQSESDHLKSTTTICNRLDPFTGSNSAHTVISAASQKRSNEQSSNTVVLNLKS